MLKPFYNIIYVEQDNKAIIVCPHCAEGKKISVARFKGSKHKFNIKCICKRTYKVFLEFREKVRQETFLRGTCINHSQMGIQSDINILDISETGLAFSNLDIFTFEVGNDISVKFTLNDDKKTVIKKNAVVRNFRQKRIGCEFYTSDIVF